MTRGGFVGCAEPHGVAEPIELGCGGIQLASLAHLERDGLIGRVALEVAKRMFARVGPETNRATIMSEISRPR